MDQKQLNEVIENGETEEVEFKKSTAQLEKGLRAICAFLNYRGGAVYFGIDKGKFVGQQVSDQTVKSISQKIRQRIKPEVTPEITVPGAGKEKVIKVTVKEGLNKIYYLDGVAYKRVGTENIVMPPEEIERIILERRKITLDSEICEGASLKDIDKEKVKWFLRKAKYERNFDVDPEIPIKEVLEKLELMKNEKLTNASVLLFGKKPQRFFLQAETRCARFKGTEPLEFIDMKVFKGNVISQRDDAVEFVKEHIKLHAKIVGTERVETWEYPIEAIREGISNAICHRDYEIHSNVQVRIFDDRIEVWNPGTLLKGLTIEKLKGKHESILRNPMIGKCFFLIKFIEQWGTGTNRIIRETLNYGLPEPIFEDTKTSFVLTFRKYRISDELLKTLNERQQKSIEHIKEKGAITTAEYQSINDIGKVYSVKELNEMVAAGIIYRTGKGRSVKYVLK